MSHSNNEDELINVPSQQVEVHHEEQEEHAPVEVVESVLERDHEEEIFLIIEDEIQIIPHPTLAQHQPPVFIEAPRDFTSR